MDQSVWIPVRPTPGLPGLLDPWPALGPAPSSASIHSPFAASVRLGRSNVSKFRSASASFFPGTEGWHALRSRVHDRRVCTKSQVQSSPAQSPKGTLRHHDRDVPSLRGVRLAQDRGDSGAEEQPNHVSSGTVRQHARHSATRLGLKFPSKDQPTAASLYLQSLLQLRKL